MRIESFATGAAVSPMWSLWAPIATYSPRSAGSLPRTMPITLRAGVATGSEVKRTSIAAWVPAAPGARPAIGDPSRRAAAASETMKTGVSSPPAPSTICVRGRDRKRERAPMYSSATETTSAEGPETSGRPRSSVRRFGAPVVLSTTSLPRMCASSSASESPIAPPNTASASGILTLRRALGA